MRANPIDEEQYVFIDVRSSKCRDQKNKTPLRIARNPTLSTDPLISPLDILTIRYFQIRNPVIIRKMIQNQC